MKNTKNTPPSQNVVINVIMSAIKRDRWVVIFKDHWAQPEKKFYSEKAMRKFIAKNNLNVIREVGVLL